MAIAIFNFQYKNNKVYRTYVDGIKVNVAAINKINQIPFLPIEFFKTHKVILDIDNSDPCDIIFTSSGGVKSKHYVKNVSIYEESYLLGFENFYGAISDYCVLALLPSYLERDGSSLIYMMEDLIQRSKHADSDFYLNNYDELIQKINELNLKGQKTILIGVTYALLELMERKPLMLNNTIVMETGGMKGKRKEMVREELHQKLCNGYGVASIHSEYGMTELLSQAYSKGEGFFECPPWMQVIIRDTNDPFHILTDTRTGAINVIDLANIYSCSFIATQDLGKKYANGSFEVLGRFDNSDIRGCNLLIE